MQSANNSIAHQSVNSQIGAQRQRLEVLHQAIEHSDDIATLHPLADRLNVADELVAAIRASLP
jgi:hypothetical protein